MGILLARHWLLYPFRKSQISLMFGVWGGSHATRGSLATYEAIVLGEEDCDTGIHLADSQGDEHGEMWVE